MVRASARLSLVPLALALAACPFGPGDDPDPDAPEALHGFWQYTIAGDVETSMHFGADGTLRVIDAWLGDQRCETARGTWTASGGVISYQLTEENGQPSSDAGTVAYGLDGTVLTLDPGGVEQEVLTRYDGPLPICADYGWPSLVIYQATIGGTTYDFTDPGPNPAEVYGMTIGQLATTGEITMDGRIGGAAYPCPTCQLLTIMVSNPAGSAIAAGTYTGSTSGDAWISYQTSIAATPPPSATFRSDQSDSSGTQFGTASVTITLIEEYRIAGSFSGTLWDGDGSTSLPISGSFEIRYD